MLNNVCRHWLICPTCKLYNPFTTTTATTTTMAAVSVNQTVSDTLLNSHIIIVFAIWTNSLYTQTHSQTPWKPNPATQGPVYPAMLVWKHEVMKGEIRVIGGAHADAGEVVVAVVERRREEMEEEDLKLLCLITNAIIALTPYSWSVVKIATWRVPELFLPYEWERVGWTWG